MTLHSKTLRRCGSLMEVASYKKNIKRQMIELSVHNRLLGSDTFPHPSPYSPPQKTESKAFIQALILSQIFLSDATCPLHIQEKK